jgi:DNA-binding SARP family transcriptional activator
MNGKVTYHQQISYCGKPRCRKCREGVGHGPYWYAYTTENGRTTRTYIGKNLPVGAQALQESPPVHLEAVALRVRTLGQFRLERHNGQEWQTVEDASWQHQRVRALLASLLSSPGRKLGREQVMDVLWPEADIETASSRLDRSVYSLRQALEPALSRPASSRLLRMEREGLILADQAQLWVDADEFEHLLNQAHSTNDPGAREKLLEEASILYGGEFLPEERYSDWIITRRESLQRAWMGLLLELADLRIARDALSLAIEPLDSLLAADPANEAAVQRLIISLAQLDRRGEALRAYHRFATGLQRVFNVAPKPETRALYEAVQQGESQAPLTFSPQPYSSAEVLVGSERETSVMSVQGFKVQIGRSHQTPLIGRDQELETMDQLLQASERGVRAQLAGRKKATSLPLDTQRRPQCILLVGEAGIGKTRLAEELSQGAQKRGWAVAWSRVYAQESSVPYRQWTEVLRSAMTHGLWQRQEISRRPLVYQPLSSLLPELNDLLPEVVYPAPISPEQEQLRLWEATLELLSTISERTPLLLVLDDFHWADASSSELFAYLVRRLHDLPIVIVGTYRDNELPASNPLRPLLTDLQREQVILSIPIQPLTNEQIASLVARLQHLPGTMVQYIQNKAAGNPFFAEELARTVASAPVDQVDALNQPDNYAMLDTELALPDTIAAVLELRMGRLSSACQRLLGNAAVLGGSFTFHVIQQMETGSNANAGEDAILDLLEEAIQAGVLTEEGTGSRINYQFWHPLLVSHLYDQLSAARRARLHRRAAEVLQRVYQGREEEGAAIITTHLVAGGAEPLQIVHYAELAANRAYNLSAYPEAEAFYRIAVSQLDEHTGPSLANATQDERSQLAYFLERLGECTRVQGNDEEARHLYERVLEVRSYQRTFANDDEYRYEAQIDALLWREIGLTWYDVGDNVQAQECCKRGEQVLREARIVSGPARGILRFQQSYIDWQEGKYEQAELYAIEALDFFNVSLQHHDHTQSNYGRLTGTKRMLANNPINLGRTHTLLAAITATVGRPTDALAHLNTALALFEQHDRQREIANVCCNIGDIHLRKAEHELAQSFFQRSLDIAERVGDVPLMSVVFGNLGVLAIRTGSLFEAEKLFDRGISLAEQTNDQVYISVFCAYLATVFQDQGKLTESRDSVYRALTIGRAIHNLPCISLALVALGNLRIAQAIEYIIILNRNQKDSKGSPTVRQSRDITYNHFLLRAKATLERVLVLQEELEAETKIEAKLAFVDAKLLLGDINTAKEYAIRTLDEAQQFELIWGSARCQRLLGNILSAQNQLHEAERYFEQAIEVFRKCDMRLEYARTLHSYGVTLLGCKDMEKKNFQQGLGYLSEARQVFDECHAALDLQRVEHDIAMYMDYREK